MRNPFDIAPDTTPADVYDALSAIVGRSHQYVINGLHFVGDGQFFGQAVTLRSLPARTDHKKKVQEFFSKEHNNSDPFAYAISLCDKKSVLVVDASGYNHTAIGGGTKMSSLVARGAQALVTDGALRDQSEFERYATQYNMNTVCADWTAQSGTGTTLYPSDVNVPVSVHGVLVRPGDYLLGNKDAVVVIPEEHAETVLETGVVIARLNDYTTKIQEDGTPVPTYDESFMKNFVVSAQLSERQLELMREHVNSLV